MRRADLLVGEDELGQRGGEVLERGGGGQVRLGRRMRSRTRRPDLGERARTPWSGSPSSVEAVVEDPVLAPVHRLLADEAGHLPLEGRDR